MLPVTDTAFGTAAAAAQPLALHSIGLDRLSSEGRAVSGTTVDNRLTRSNLARQSSASAYLGALAAGSGPGQFAAAVPASVLPQLQPNPVAASPVKQALGVQKATAMHAVHLPAAGMSGQSTAAPKEVAESAVNETGRLGKRPGSGPSTGAPTTPDRLSESEEDVTSQDAEEAS